MGQALATLGTDPSLAPLIQAPSVRLNGKIQLGTRAAFTAAMADAALVAALDARPLVRLHGDLFLENMLVRRASDPGGASLMLIESGFGGRRRGGPAAFDLVKYESYATGELPALRAEWIDVGGLRAGDDYRYRVRWERPSSPRFSKPRLAPSISPRLRSQVRPRRSSRLPVAGRLLQRGHGGEHGGVQRRARLLKATGDFAAAALDARWNA